MCDFQRELKHRFHRLTQIERMEGNLKIPKRFMRKKNIFEKRKSKTFDTLYILRNVSLGLLEYVQTKNK